MEILGERRNSREERATEIAKRVAIGKGAHGRPTRAPPSTSPPAQPWISGTQRTGHELCATHQGPATRPTFDSPGFPCMSVPSPSPSPAP